MRNTLSKYFDTVAAANFLANNDTFQPRDKRFTIPMPPPNITGKFHIGHALVMTVQDMWLRYYHQRGYNPDWLVGTDHAGIAGQTVFEKFLTQQGINDASREQKLSLMQKWRTDREAEMKAQSVHMALCDDWSRARFTLDADFTARVVDTFVKLFEAGLIYRSNRLVYWDTALQTAISDLEVEMRSINGQMHYIKYIGVDCAGIEIATTRPETLFADAAIAVHPDDSRYQSIIGRKVLVPFIDRPIPIISDKSIDPEKGTGALKITTGHAYLDAEIGARYNLPIHSVIDTNGLITEGPFSGLSVLDARCETAKRLRERGLLIKSEDIEHTVPHSSRSGCILEVIPTMQWFCDVRPLSHKALEHIDATKIVPENKTKLLQGRLRSSQPWCLSRQLWWGHQIPAWYTEDGKYFVARDEASALQQATAHYGHAVTLTRDPDVLDTWFSSSLWTVECTEHTCDLLVTGYDILELWVSRMQMMSFFLKKQPAFRAVHLLGLIRDEHGAKISKTKGNVIDPSVLIDRYGIDAFRLGLVKFAAPGTDINLSETIISDQKLFLTKIWNIAKFCRAHSCTYSLPAVITHKWNIYYVQELRRRFACIEEAFADYDLPSAWHTIYHGIYDLANLYLEGARAIWSEETAAVLGSMFVAWLRILHPIAPAITTQLIASLCPQQSVKELTQIPQIEHDTSAVSQWLLLAEELRKLHKLTGITEFTLQPAEASATLDAAILSRLSRCKCRFAHSASGQAQYRLTAHGAQITCVISSEARTKLIASKTSLHTSLTKLEEIRSKHDPETTPANIIKLTLDKIDTITAKLAQIDSIIE